MIFSKPIFTSLSPNTEKDDIVLAFKLIFQPWKWKKGDSTEKLEKEFRSYLGVNNVFVFNSGRSALLAILHALEIGKGDEVLLQGFTCNAAINPILKSGAKPVFVDIDDTLNLDPNDLKKKITSNSKAVMIQHSFGCPAQIDEIVKIAKENNLFLIEDCAHALGARYKEKLCGTFGDAAFFSFGRDKIISSVFGGMAIAKNENVIEKIRDFQREIEYPSYPWILQQLLHPILINYLVLPIFWLNSFFGKLLLVFFQKVKLVSKAVYAKEKQGELAYCFPKKLPNALAILAHNQFKKLNKFNKHRKEIVDIYKENLDGFVFQKENDNSESAYMRFSALVDFDTDEFLKFIRKDKIFLNDGWRKSAVVPQDTNLEKMEYLNNCPKAEKVAKKIINLPTHINISQDNALRIIKLLKDYGN